MRTIGTGATIFTAVVALLAGASAASATPAMQEVSIGGETVGVRMQDGRLCGIERLNGDTTRLICNGISKANRDVMLRIQLPSKHFSIDVEETSGKEGADLNYSEFEVKYHHAKDSGTIEPGMQHSFVGDSVPGAQWGFSLNGLRKSHGDATIEISRNR